MKKAKPRPRAPKTKRDRDNHHCLWPKHDWNKGYCKALRSHWYFVTKIPKKTLHTTIHHEMMWVPPPRGGNAKDAFEQVVTLERFGAIHKDDPIERRLELLIALFDCCEPETTEALRHQLDIVRKFNKKAPY